MDFNKPDLYYDVLEYSIIFLIVKHFSFPRVSSSTITTIIPHCRVIHI